MNPPDWKLQGLCRNEDPEIFFPGPTDRINPRRAKAICAQCPVIDPCRNESLHEYYGIWGGLAERDRRIIRRQNKTTNQPAA